MKMGILMAVVLCGSVRAAEKVEVEQAEKLIADKVQVLDVRTKEEWDEGHVEGAVRVDVTAGGFAEEVKKCLEDGKPVLVYCRSGGRSARAAAELEKLGYKTVYDLEGGILAWEKKGGKVVK